MATSFTEPSVPDPVPDSLLLQDRSRLLPDLNQFLLTHSDIRTAFPGICRRLNRALPHQQAGMALYEASSGELRLFAQQTAPGAPQLPAGFTLPLDGTPAGETYRLQRPILVDDLRSPQFTCETTQELLRYGTRSGCWCPLRTSVGVIGALWVTSDQPRAYRTEDAYLLNEVAGHVALALAHQLTLGQVQELQKRLETQGAGRTFREWAPAGSVGLVHCIPPCRLVDANDAFLRMVGLTRKEIQQGLSLSEITPPEFHELAAQASREIQEQGSCLPYEKEFIRPDGTRIPVLMSGSALHEQNPGWVAFVVDLRGRRTLADLPRPAAVGSPQTPATEALAANSAAMFKILREVEKVAPTDATMLLLGETGTGKEVLAHLICQMSPRRDRPFVKVNCAAIPAGLLESELFGHEKGAFTGAQTRKIGRLELAHQGTLFLDEIGDIPLELQPKMLRVLQERSFERLGGTQTIKVDVRLVAATNRDLAAMTASNQFRRDLFYRLNVFPVRVPALRERPESIPFLVNIFVRQFAERMNRPNLTVPPETLTALQRWIWPGNIRELENLIERAVILSPGPELRVNLDDLKTEQTAPTAAGDTLQAVEREHIRHVLHDTNGVVGGKHGAASRLGLKRTTLQYKMKKLEISRY